MAHVYEHVQGHITGVFRPGVLPSGTVAPTGGYGPELLDADVNFDSSVGWSFGGLEWDIPGDGVAYCNTSAAVEQMTCSFTSPLQLGHTYRLEVYVTACSEQCNMRVFEGYDYGASLGTTVGVFSQLLLWEFTVTTAAATQFDVAIEEVAGLNTSVEVTSMSLKEIL